MLPARSHSASSINSSMNTSPRICLRHARLLPIMTMLALLLIGCGKEEPHASGNDSISNGAGSAPARTPVVGIDVVNSWPHDTGAFTQGLLFHNGSLYESTGLNGRSSLRRINLETGEVIQRIDVDSQYFAEGLALYNGKLFQLTWRSGTGFVYDLETFKRLGQFNYYNEGWGLTSDSSFLYMSDGTNVLRVLDPETLKPVRTIPVFDGETTIPELNELEWIRGEIWANIWQTDRIVRIDPATGRVIGYVDLSGILSPQDRRTGIDVLNGIAWDPETDRIWVTGKLWPRVFEIRLKQPPIASASGASTR